jgi:sec-independent protein translocase protein TatB
MLPQIGSTELVVVAIIALIVIGPKDLPALLRKLGQFVGRLRGMANEFRSSFDEMARQSELDELRREVAAMREASLSEQAALGEHLENINNEINTDMALPVLEDDAVAYDQTAYDPQAFAGYGETPVEKVVNRRRKVAAAEGEAMATKPKAAAKAKSVAASPKAAKTTAAKPTRKAKA